MPGGWTKSMVYPGNGRRMGRELRRLADSLVDDFPRAHMTQAAMKEFVSSDIENDQNCFWR